LLGSSISHYKIVEKLGEGGMGVVYKAEDTRLERSVALKFLPAHLLGNEEVRKRFEREAKSAASLDHPNVCHVYEIDEVEGKTFISMSLVEGVSLDQKIAEGPLKLDEALSIGQQIAKGLNTAHKRGIIHRDIKPENIMVGEDGHVTIMDFGLAQLTEASRLTKTDETVGTVAYMSPEQTDGSGTDHRTDIWSLGVVLYEMVTGRQPFQGDYDKAVMYSILNEDAEPITALRTGVPMELEVFVGKALKRSADQRYQTSADLALDLQGLIGMPQPPTGGADLTQAVHPSTASGPKGHFVFVLGLVLVAALGSMIYQAMQASIPRESGPLRRFALPFEGETVQDVVISPDGRHVAYTTGEAPNLELWVRDLDRLSPRKIVLPTSALSPFWSPDNEFLAFSTWEQGGSGELQRVSIRGGPSLTVTRLPGALLGGTWSNDGASIVFSSAGAGRGLLYEAPALGGSYHPLDVTDSPDERATAAFTPHSLPPDDGRRTMLFVAGGEASPTIKTLDLESGQSATLVRGEDPVYSPSGHVIYSGSGLLWALPFSPRTLRAIGDPFPLAAGGAKPSVSRDGTLVYVQGQTEDLRRLVWRDRRGQEMGTIGHPQPQLRMPVLSPDDTRVAVVANEGDNADIWIHETGRALARRLSVDEAGEDRAAWMAGGRDVTFTSTRTGRVDIFMKPSDGSREAEEVFKSDERDYGYEWSYDGNFLVGSGGGKLWYLEKGRTGAYEKKMLIDSNYDAVAPSLSPDASLVAYESNESGRYEIYVQPFPDGGPRWQVSADGGRQARWSMDGREILYVRGNTLMSAAVERELEFRVTQAVPLFDHPRAFVGRGLRYDVSQDGQRILLSEPLAELDSKPSIVVVENWYEEFRDRERVESR